MNLIIESASWIFLVSGGIFILIGSIGLLRFPDLFTRLHAASVTETMGVGLTLIGLILQAGLSLISIKLMLILLFLFFTGPTAVHALAKAAMHGGVKPLVPEEGDSPSKR